MNGVASCQMFGVVLLRIQKVLTEIISFYKWGHAGLGRLNRFLATAGSGSTGKARCPPPVHWSSLSWGGTSGGRKDGNRARPGHCCWGEAQGDGESPGQGGLVPASSFSLLPLSRWEDPWLRACGFAIGRTGCLTPSAIQKSESAAGAGTRRHRGWTGPSK